MAYSEKSIEWSRYVPIMLDGGTVAVCGQCADKQTEERRHRLIFVVELALRPLTDPRP